MAANDLTTLANVKAWIPNAPSTADDALLTRLIATTSRFFVEATNRFIAMQTFTDTLDGDDLKIKVRPTVGLWPGGLMFGSEGVGGAGARGWAVDFENTPVIDVSQVLVDGQLIPALPALLVNDPNNNLGSSGWALAESRRLEFRGYRFTIGVQNVSMTYRAGYSVPAEAWTIPGTPYQVQTSTLFVADLGVTFTSNGAALTKVTSGPTTGQYSVSSTGLYTFAAADTTKGVSLNYANVPADIEQAVIEMVALNYNARGRVGQSSKTVGGETISFYGGAVPMSAQQVIDSHRRETL